LALSGRESGYKREPPKLGVPLSNASFPRFNKGPLATLDLERECGVH
jgi:hypothetical protein